MSGLKPETVLPNDVSSHAAKLYVDPRTDRWMVEVQSWDPGCSGDLDVVKFVDWLRAHRPELLVSDTATACHNAMVEALKEAKNLPRYADLRRSINAEIALEGDKQMMRALDKIDEALRGEA